MQHVDTARMTCRRLILTYGVVGITTRSTPPPFRAEFWNLSIDPLVAHSVYSVQFGNALTSLYVAQIKNGYFPRARLVALTTASRALAHTITSRLIPPPNDGALVIFDYGTRRGSQVRACLRSLARRGTRVSGIYSVLEHRRAPKGEETVAEVAEAYGLPRYAVLRASDLAYDLASSGRHRDFLSLDDPRRLITTLAEQQRIYHRDRPDALPSAGADECSSHVLSSDGE